MKKLQKTKQAVLKVAALALGTSLLFSSCSFSSETVKQKIGTLETVETTYSETKQHTLDASNLIFVTKTGLIELYLDTTSFGVSVREVNTGKYWNALPVAGVADHKAAVLEATVLKDGKRYKLNTQDNSVAFGSASFKPKENGVLVTYDLALDEATANSAFESLPQDALYVSLTVNYTLIDGAMYVSLNCNEMLCSAGCTVESVELLPYFGATAEDNAKDYLFLPDGSGAISYLTAPKEEEAPVKTFVPYGPDAAVFQNMENKKPSTLAAFGMKSGESAFAALVEGGDTVSEIVAHSKTADEPFYRVGTKFMVQDVAYKGKTGKQTQYLGNRHGGEVKICYRFLSHNNASYTGMATACRELLIRRGLLSTKPITETEYLPFLLTAQASAPKSVTNGAKILTDFTELEELLSLMKAKSINHVLVRYNGALDGSLKQKELGRSDLLGGLGNEKDLDALQQYVKTQQFSLFLNVNLLSFPKTSQSAKTLTSDVMRTSESNPFAAYSGKETLSKKFLSLDKVASGVEEFVNGESDAKFGGYCIDDAGSLLYSDYRDAYSRLKAADLLSKQASTLSAGHKLMVDTGNVYLLKNADVIADLPSTCGYPETENYVGVPFLQMIFHGTLDYAHTAFNLEENPDKAFLKSMEYGAVPSYTWYFKKTDNEGLDAVYHYEKQIGAAAKNYEKANEALKDLRDARMTGHGKVQNGVYFTEYNNSTLLYFNYNETPVTVNSITIEPMSFLRIN